MTGISPLQFIHKKGLFGDHHEKKESDLLEISEVKNYTSVVEVNADLEGTNNYNNDLGDEIEDVYIHFFGLIREESDGNPVAFSEVWTLSKNISKNSGWILSGITQSKE